jgi:hypothetical protein
MPTLFQTLRSRWFAVLMQVGLWLLLILAIRTLGGTAPRFAITKSPPAPPPPLIPLKRIETAFDTSPWPRELTGTNSINPFFTKHFIPPVPPPPPPPTTRKVELTYHGFYQTGDSPKFAWIRVGDTLTVAAPGGKAVANLFVANITMQSLLLTNPAAQTNLLLLNAKKEVEVPIQ